MDRCMETSEQLVAQYQRGDKEALNKLLKKNDRLAHKAVNQWRVRDTESHYDDLLQEARIAMMRCADLFDASLNWKFSTYAYNSMIRRIQRFLHNYKLPLHVPGRPVNDILQRKWYEYDPTKRSMDIADLSMSHMEVEEYLSQREQVAEAMKFVDSRTLRIIRLRFLKKRTLKELAMKEGLTKERIRQIQQNGIARIRKLIEELGMPKSKKDRVDPTIRSYVDKLERDNKTLTKENEMLRRELVNLKIELQLARAEEGK